MYSTNKSTSFRKSSSVVMMKVYWLLLLLLLLLVFCGCPTTMAVKSRNAKSWLQNNLGKDNVYVFPMTGIQVHFLKVMEQEEDDDVYYYNGEGNVKVKYSSKLVDGTIITPETQTTLNSDTMIMGLWESLMAMKEGEIWEVFVPAKMAGKEVKVPKGEALIYTLELIQIADDDDDDNSNKQTLKELDRDFCDPQALRGCQEWELTYAKKLFLECDHDYDCLLVEKMELKKWTGNLDKKEMDPKNSQRLFILDQLLKSSDAMVEL